MSTLPAAATSGLPDPVARVLEEFVSRAQAAFGGDLVSVVLYGSAAEGRMRATSDVNVVAVLAAFRPDAVAAMAETLRLGQAAVKLEVMLLLDSEIDDAAVAFAAKFTDLGRRHRVLFGSDPFVGRAVPRDAAIHRLKQVLLNLILRWRSAYALRSGREEQLVAAVAEAAGPLRSMAATLLELETGQVVTPKAALLELAETLGEPGARDAVTRLSEAREAGVLPVGTAGPTLLSLMGLAESLRQRARALR